LSTVALALERLGAMRIPSSRSHPRRRATVSASDTYPTVFVIVGIVAMSAIFNVPRFFEMRVEYHEELTLQKINDTGVPHLDHGIVTVLN
jgi:hypothetical protein